MRKWAEWAVNRALAALNRAAGLTQYVVNKNFPRSPLRATSLKTTFRLPSND